MTYEEAHERVKQSLWMIDKEYKEKGGGKWIVAGVRKDQVGLTWDVVFTLSGDGKKRVLYKEFKANYMLLTEI